MDDYLSPPRILERLQSERDALIARVHRIPADLHDKRPDPARWSIAEVLEHLDRVTHPHPVFGLLTLRSWVAFSADHEARHSDQIADVAQRLGAG
jgi:hypothetical protein